MEQNIEALSINEPKGWTDKNILKQGLYFSLVFQFFLITLPYVIWKPYYFPGAVAGIGDILFVILFSMAAIIIISIVFSLYYKISMRKVSKDTMTKIAQVTGLVANVLGFVLVLFSLYPGMNYTLNVQFDDGLKLDIDALLPSLLLLATVVSQALLLMVLVLFLDIRKEDFGKACTWGLVFTLIPVATGFISFTTVIMPGGMYLSFFASIIMFGISALMINPSSLEIIERTGARNMEALVEGSPAVEATSYNITGYLFLIPFLLFHYVDPAFTSSALISEHTTILLLLPIVIAGGVAFLGHLSGDSRLHGRLLGGVAINIFLAFLIFYRYLRVYPEWASISESLDWIYNGATNAPLQWAYIQAVLVGAGMGLVIEPVFRSLLKFKYFRFRMNRITAYAVLTVFLTPFMIGLSAIWSSDKGSLEGYEVPIFLIFIILAIVPLVGSLDYHDKVKFNPFSWRKPIKIILLVLLIIGFIMLILDILVMWLVEDGWASLIEELEALI